MAFISYVNYSIAIILSVCYAYQVFFIFVSIFRRTKQYRPARPHKFAIVIPARNEAVVIEQLIESIKQQNYPDEFIETFIVADNCTDQTAEIARHAGATVWERFNKKYIGKGYALNFLFSKILMLNKSFDAYIIIDADNILDPNYINEMNKAFSSGYRIITSYRNSKNFGRNWLSAGYSLWFLREAKFLNNARMILGTSCAVSGTGFLVHHEIIENNNGWKHFLLTEDIEFTVDSVLNDERIAYCSSAILYDEQPTEFSQAWQQRLRWAKGILQVFKAYGWRLLQKFIGSGCFANYDMLMIVFPVIIFALVALILNLCAATIYAFSSGSQLLLFLHSVWIAFCNGYFYLFVIGLLTLITEWKQIHCPTFKKILYVFSFPIFMMTFIPVSIVALFKKVRWEEIHHSTKGVH